MGMPLEGIRVIDLSSTIAGPFCTSLLGDMGADVVKIEEPGKGDDSRHSLPAYNGMSCFFVAYNRNKRSLAVNLKDPRGLEICLKLIRKAHILVENLRQGVTTRLGLDYEKILAENPGIIYCSISAFGRKGPLSHRVGYEAVMQAYGGMMSVTGFEDDPRPVRCGYSVTDIFTGLTAYGSIVTALYNRERTGKGTYIEATLLNTQVIAMGHYATSYLIAGEIPVKAGSGGPRLGLYQAFEAKDGYFVIGVNTERLWQRFCDALGRRDLLSAPEFCTHIRRVENCDKLVAIFSDLFRSKSVNEWVQLFDQAGIPCSRVNTLPQVLEDEQVRLYQMIVEATHPTLGTLKLLGTPLKLSGAEHTVKVAPPLLGEHTDEILSELGYDATERNLLKQEGVIASP